MGRNAKKQEKQEEAKKTSTKNDDTYCTYCKKKGHDTEKCQLDFKEKAFGKDLYIRNRKVGFYGICRPEYVEPVREIVQMFSELLHQGSILVDNIFTIGNEKLVKHIVEADKKPSFEPYFRALGVTGPTLKPCSTIDGVRDVAKQLNLKIDYNLHLCTHMLSQAMVEYNTNAENNICLNGFTRVRKYLTHVYLAEFKGGTWKEKRNFRKECYKKAMGKTLLLFTPKDPVKKETKEQDEARERKKKKDLELPSLFQEENFEKLDFSKLKSNWWKFLPFYSRVRQVLKDFPITPNYKNKTRHCEK